ISACASRQNAIFFPSGDQLGETSVALVRVSSFASPPFADATKMPVGLPSSANAIRAPSGDHAISLGSPDGSKIVLGRPPFDETASKGQCVPTNASSWPSGDQLRPPFSSAGAPEVIRRRPCPSARITKTSPESDPEVLER